MSLLYVFAFTNTSAPALRHGSRRIEFIELSGIHAAVERVAERPAVSEAALRAQHEIVMKIANTVDAVLPARFGALLDTRELEAIVSTRLAPITKTLELVSGRVQMTVRVFASGKPARARESPSEEPSTGAEAPATGTAYLEQRRRERAAPLTGTAGTISRAMAGLVQAERSQPGEGRVEWTLYHLVDRQVLPQYERAMEPFKSPRITVTGPWPPFAFVPDLWP
jgi:hypothetical protein